MKKIILTLLMCFVCSIANASDWWVFVELNDKPGVTLDDDKGMPKKGDILQVVPAVLGEEPTPTEQENWAIYVVEDVTQEDINSWLEGKWVVEENWKGDVVPVRKAGRNKKYELGTDKKGFKKTKKVKKDDFKLKIKDKTEEDYASYRFKSRLYRYVQRPAIRVANIITPRAMAADNTSKICAVGANCTDEDYNTLAAWESALNGDLVTSTTREIAELYDDDGQITGCTIDGGTTNSSYYMMITAPSAERHSGFEGTGVQVGGNAHAGESVIQLDDEYPVVEWIECDGSANDDSSATGCIGTTQYGGHLQGRYIRNVIVYDSVDDGIRMTGYSWVYNSISYDNVGHGIRNSYANDPLIAQNCTSIGNGDDGFYALNSDLDCDNCIAMDNASNDFQDGSGPSNYFYVDYSMSSDSTANDFGDTVNALVDKVSSSQFLSVGNRDLHLKSTSDAVGAGSDMGGTNNEDIDIDGRDRDTEGDTWDMGADQENGNTADCANRYWTCTNCSDCGSNGGAWLGTTCYQLTQTYRITTDFMDCEESISSGVVNCDASSDLELGAEGLTEKIVGVRFLNISVPQDYGENIATSKVTFTADANHGGETINVDITGDDADDSAALTEGTSDLSNRTDTTAVVQWDNIPEWTVGNNYDSDDISTILSEIVERASWVEGNAVTILFTADTVDVTREAESYTGASGASQRALLTLTLDSDACSSTTDATMWGTTTLKGTATIQ